MDAHWNDVGSADEFEPGCAVRALAGGVAIAVFNLDGSLFATRDDCTHGSASLSEGYVCGDEIECPMHMGRFHIPTGKALRAPCVVDLQTFRVQVRDRRVLVCDAGSGE